MTRDGTKDDKGTTLYVVLFCVVLIVGWMFVIYQPLRQQKNFAQNMINRELNRMEARATLPDPPKTAPEVLRQRLEVLQGERDGLLAEVTEYEDRFVDYRDAEALRRLRLDVAEQATEAGLVLKLFGAETPEGEISDSAEALASQIRAPYGRPVLKLEATGSYGQISDFVTRLGRMKQSASILRFGIRAPSFDEMVSDKSSVSRLGLLMELAL